MVAASHGAGEAAREQRVAQHAKRSRWTAALAEGCINHGQHRNGTRAHLLRADRKAASPVHTHARTRVEGHNEERRERRHPPACTAGRVGGEAPRGARWGGCCCEA
mgnify:CR=1 FL=1